MWGKLLIIKEIARSTLVLKIIIPNEDLLVCIDDHKEGISGTVIKNQTNNFFKI